MEELMNFIYLFIYILVAEIESRASHVQSTYSATNLHPDINYFW
jgi:hypothetical protein